MRRDKRSLNDVQMNGFIVDDLWTCCPTDTVYVVKTWEKCPDEKDEKGNIVQKREGQIAMIQEYTCAGMSLSDDETKVRIKLKENKKTIEVPFEFESGEHAIETGVFLNEKLAVFVEDTINAKFKEDLKKELEDMDDRYNRINSTIAEINARRANSYMRQQSEDDESAE